MNNKSLIVLSALLVFSQSVSAMGSCAIDAYEKACTSCGFEAGRIDKKCKDGYEAGGKLCLGKEYPAMSLKYPLGMCPAVDECVSRLKACTSVSCPGNDLEDCANPLCKACYRAGDRCVHMASKDCENKKECGDGECSKDAGEDQKSCCEDCGCPEDLACEKGECVKQSTTTTTLVGERPNYGSGYALDSLCFPFWLLVPISLFTPLIVEFLK